MRSSSEYSYAKQPALCYLVYQVDVFDAFGALCTVHSLSRCFMWYRCILRISNLRSLFCRTCIVQDFLKTTCLRPNTMCEFILHPLVTWHRSVEYVLSCESQHHISETFLGINGENNTQTSKQSTGGDGREISFSNRDGFGICVIIEVFFANFTLHTSVLE